MKPSYPILILVSLVIANAYAQPDEAKDLPRPIRMEYHSVLTQYQAYREQTLTPWVEANDTVARIGGWRVYAKEAQMPPQAQPVVNVEATK
ncbi:hypothetical protein ACFQNF_17795 [Iodobacter arcticus]|uniref:Uncharacterized protein n=1 Tax=Iodobacter arcticus TaxID=590593 RepID=A0ABW2R1T7_9NEIS